MWRATSMPSEQRDGTTRPGIAADYLTPFATGVTGHRDLLASEVAGLHSKIAALFDELRDRFLNTSLRPVTALSAGADRLAAYAAPDADIDVTAIMPMPVEM